MEWDMSSDGWGGHSGLLWWYIISINDMSTECMWLRDVNVLIWDFVKFSSGIALFSLS